MATDIQLVKKNLARFYEFADKEVIHVGAGGGQMIDYVAAKKVIAIDNDEFAIKLLKEQVRLKGLENKFQLVL